MLCLTITAAVNRINIPTHKEKIQLTKKTQNDVGAIGDHIKILSLQQKYICLTSSWQSQSSDILEFVFVNDMS